MNLNFARPLNSNELAFSFLENVLEMDQVEADEATQSVAAVEMLLKISDLSSTLDSSTHRRRLYATDEKRIILRRKIFDELVTLERLENDDNIRMGNGGAIPGTPVLTNGQAIIITGLPASGKSTIANNVADIYGAYIVDPDYATRKFPEFPINFGATLVHKEASLVTFGRKDDLPSDELSLYEFCSAKNINMVIPKIGNNADSVRQLRDALIEKGYMVHLILISVERQEACKRVLERFLRTNRYVPLGLVFDGYSNDPILTYYRTRNDEQWASVGKLKTIEHKYVAYHCDESGPVQELKDRKMVS